jgi:hypothetical protein
MAIEMITTTIPNQVFNHIKSHTTTMEMWNAIKAIHQTYSKMAALDLGKKMQDTKLHDYGNAHVHIASLMNMQEQLTS